MELFGRLALAALCLGSSIQEPLVRSAASGPWSVPGTWEGGRVPGAGARVQVRAGHEVLYDIRTERAFRLVHVAGTLTFARDRDTRLDVGVLKVQPGDDPSEDGFRCDARPVAGVPGALQPSLLVGTAAEPIPAGKTAILRLTYFEGMDSDTCPAIASCGGRMEFHGAPIGRSWLKLGADARKGTSEVVLEEAPAGWKSGDRVILTATKRDGSELGSGRPGPGSDPLFTEERILKAVDGARLTLDRPLDHDHRGSGDFRGEAANLSRNVIIESADPAGVRGHTLYHRGGAGSISYAEFRHLGKEGRLGRYALHYHLVGDTMRGSSVVGASFWDSHNRWITIHGTNYLQVRDCVGYRSVGHGFFLEDGTEVHNVFDRNLAVQAFRGKRLPKQVFPFDGNEGAGFWWANSLNTFTRNVTCENDRYGYRFEATFSKSRPKDLELEVLGRTVDIRTLPFVRFEDNEAHGDGLYGFNLGEGVDLVGPDARHPFVVRRMKIWDVHYAFRPQSPSLLVEDLRIHEAAYGVYHPNFDRHEYRRLTISDTVAEPFNRGHDDVNRQYGALAVDGLTIERCSGTLIQMSQYAPGGKAECHFRNVVFKDNRRSSDAWVNTTLNGQPKEPPPDDVVPYYFHDWFGPGRHAKVLTAAAAPRAGDGLQYVSSPPFTGARARAAEVRDVPFPKLLDPVDDLPPATVVTSVTGRLVRGMTSDNGTVARVRVNGREARARAPNFAEWEAELEEGETRIVAAAEDAAGNVEPTPHEVSLR